MKRRVFPINDAVIVQLHEAQDKTEGGIILVEEKLKQTNTATVVAVGPGIRTADGQTHAPSVKPGDEVLLVSSEEPMLREIRWGGAKLHLTTENNIVGVIREVEET